MPTIKQEIRICLFQLPEKDQAVIQRVITFGASQGKPYTPCTDPSDAHIVITLDDIPLPAHNAVSICIENTGSASCDLRLVRPLLVTRVMRMLDDAATLYKSRPIAATPAPAVKEAISQPPPETVTQAIATPVAPSEPVAIAQPVAEAVTQTIATPAAPSEPVAIAQPVAETVTKTEVSEPTASVNNATPNTPPQEVTCEEVVTTTETADSHLYVALVVDDSAAIRKQLEIELRNAQIKAEFAETGEEALEKSQCKHYDLVFLDIIMPGIDGYEVCRQMRSRKDMKKTPIIMLSGKTSPLDEVQGVIAGASTYLTKPVKHEQFQQTLKRVSKWLTNFSR